MDDINILAAIRQIANERKIDVEEILEAIKEAIKTGYKNAYDIEERDLIVVEVDPEEGSIVVYIKKDVVEKVEDEKLEISLEDAKEIDDELELGDTVLIDITAEGEFGRIAAQTARQVILQNIRESEKDAAIAGIQDRMGEVEQVTIQRVLGDGKVICEINRARAIMHKEDRVPTEFYQLGSRVKVLLLGIEEDERGKYVHISRSAPEFLEALFRQEVPEIESGTVEIVAIAREEGSRSKVAVKSNSEGIDAIGSCVGQKGVRINAIMNELKLGKTEEKIDIIPWDDDIETFLLYSIRPAEGIEIKIIDEEKKEVEIIVPKDQYPLAVGREGQNSRLAQKLTGWKITITPDEPLDDMKKDSDDSPEANEEEASEQGDEVASGQDENEDTEDADEVVAESGEEDVDEQAEEEDDKNDDSEEESDEGEDKESDDEGEDESEDKEDKKK